MQMKVIVNLCTSYKINEILWEPCETPWQSMKSMSIDENLCESMKIDKHRNKSTSKIEENNGKIQERTRKHEEKAIRNFEIETLIFHSQFLILYF